MGVDPSIPGRFLLIGIQIQESNIVFYTVCETHISYQNSVYFNNLLSVNSRSTRSHNVLIKVCTFSGLSLLYCNSSVELSGEN